MEKKGGFAKRPLVQGAHEIRVSADNFKSEAKMCVSLKTRPKASVMQEWTLVYSNSSVLFGQRRCLFHFNLAMCAVYLSKRRDACSVSLAATNTGTVLLLAGNKSYGGTRYEHAVCTC